MRFAKTRKVQEHRDAVTAAAAKHAESAARGVSAAASEKADEAARAAVDNAVNR